MKPPPYTGRLRAGNCSNLTALHLFPWLCSPNSHLQSIPAVHTPKNSHLIYLHSLCRIQALKSISSHSVVQQPFQEQSCKQLLNVDSPEQGKKNHLPHPRDPSLPLAASRLLSWLTRPIMKKNPFSIGIASHRALALMDVTHSILSHMVLSGRSNVKI